MAGCYYGLSQACIAGFAFTDCYQLLCADRFHIDTGVFHHVWTHIRGTQSVDAIHQVNTYIDSCTGNTLLPKQHVQMTQAGSINTYEETADYAKLLPVALLCLPETTQEIKLVSGMHCHDTIVSHVSIFNAIYLLLFLLPLFACHVKRTEHDILFAHLIIHMSMYSVSGMAEVEGCSISH